MERIEDLVERLRHDPELVAELTRDPAAVLRGLDLSADDLDRLAAVLRPPAEVPAEVHHFADLFVEPPDGL